MVTTISMSDSHGTIDCTNGNRGSTNSDENSENLNMNGSNEHTNAMDENNIFMSTSSFSFSSCDALENSSFDTEVVSRECSDSGSHVSGITIPLFEELSDDLICQGIATEESWILFHDPDAWNLKQSEDSMAVDDEVAKPHALSSSLDTTLHSPRVASLNLMDLPNVLLCHLVSYLDVPSIQKVICTNKSWRNRLLGWNDACVTTEASACTTVKIEGDDHDDSLRTCMNTIWLPRYYEKFPFLQQQLDIIIANGGDMSNLLTVDGELDVSPIVLSDDRTYITRDGKEISRNHKSINHPLLLSLAAENVPTGVDEKQIQIIQNHYERLHQRNERQQRFQYNLDPHMPIRRIICQPTEIKLVEVLLDNACDIHRQTKTRIGVAFTGEIGNGDRCIRSDRPLPRPIVSSNNRHKRAASGDSFNYMNNHADMTDLAIEHHYQSTMSVGIVMLQSLVLRLQRETNVFDTMLNANNDYEINQNHNHVANQYRQYQEQMNRVLRLLSQQHSSEHEAANRCKNSHACWKPFVAPFMLRNGELSVTPRLVSYYEISIHSLSPSQDDATESVIRNDQMDANQFIFGGHRIRSQCIAIGLGVQSFSLIDRMPGWDRNSFGYHGDDGGLFHGAGMMKRKFIPNSSTP